MNTKFLNKLTVAIISSFLITSCIKSEVDPVGFGDAYIIVEVVGQDTLKGLGLHAFSYAEFSSVSVNLSSKEDIVYTLQPYMNYHQDFIWNTPRDQFKKELPEAGEYIFNATFKTGQTHTFFDRLYSTITYPPKITKCEYVRSNERVDVEWEAVTNADSYNVKLLNQNGEVLFVSPVLNRITNNYLFTKNTQGWQTSSYPANGQELIVEVASYLLEVGARSGELQSIGKSRHPIVWGN